LRLIQYALTVALTEAKFLTANHAPSLLTFKNAERTFAMTSKTNLAFAAVLAALALVSSASGQSNVWTDDSAKLNTVSLNLTSAHLDPAMGNNWIRAFVPTGSASSKCLATLGESNAVVPGIVLLGGARAPIAFGGTPGILVTILFPEPPTIPDFFVSVTLYQKGAVRYGAPRLCTANDGC